MVEVEQGGCFNGCSVLDKLLARGKLLHEIAGGLHWLAKDYSGAIRRIAKRPEDQIRTCQKMAVVSA